MNRQSDRPIGWAALVGAVRSCCRSVAGSAAVETALVLPFALLLLTGAAQAGYMLFVYNSMLQVAQEAARDVAIDASTAAEARSWAEAKFSSFGDGLAVSLTEASSEIEVTISLPLTSIAIIDPLGIFRSGNLNAVATAKDQS